jgi:dipeptidyl aminopeptidase/acylaminoacyl peptidase
LIREGKGSFRSVSDEAVVFQDGNVMRIETLQGKPLGSFPVKPEMKCYNITYPLSAETLYYDDCKKIRVVDYDGRLKSELVPPKGWRAHQSWSGDGQRILFHNLGRKISAFRSAGEIFLAFASLGAGVGDEQDNREEVQVLDTSTGNSCFDWKRSFAEGSVTLEQDAAISPSGEFVAIAAAGTLKIYRLPKVCRGNR